MKYCNHRNDLLLLCDIGPSQQEDILKLSYEVTQDISARCLLDA